MTEPNQGSDADDPTAAAVVARALVAYRALADLGEQVTDEWQYVTDLTAVYSADLNSLAADFATLQVAPDAIRAVDLAIEEIGLIADPHRAIDWLSTFPQIVRLTLAPAAARTP